MPAKDLKPIYVDYQKDINKSAIKGTEILSVKNTINNLYTMYYYVEMGKWHDKLLPIAVDYLQYLGTKKYNADDISKTFYQTASDFGVSSGNDESYVYLNGLNENFKKDVELFEHLLLNCEADDEALKDMIAGIKKKRQDAKLNKNVIRQGLSSYARYGADNPFNYVLTNQELDAITANQLINILHNLTSYKHRILYYGPMTSAEFNSTIFKLHKQPSVLKPTPAMHQFNFTKQTKNEVLFTDYDMVQSELTWVRNGDTYNEAKLPVINLFNEYFGGSMSGVVFQDIRESKALAYSTFATYTVPVKKEDPFGVVGYVGCQSDKMKESIEAMQSLLSNLPKSDKMLDQAKLAITNNISTTRITKTGILFNYLNALKKGSTYDVRKLSYDQVPKMDFNTINKFFVSDIANKNFKLCVVANEKKADMKELENYGAVTKLSLKDLFGY
jgi:predicted Zn-dependent peptidase